jgi:hypothetical protein
MRAFIQLTMAATIFAAVVTAPSLGAQATAAGQQPLYQLRHWNGQGLAPVYEGWDQNEDGTYNMWFGYMNRNFEETLDVPVGPENKFEPGQPDRGQPTFFDTRRHKDIFRVVVPKDFGENTKLNWTLTVRGKSEVVSGTLNRVWQIDRRRTTRGGNSEQVNSNTPPEVKATPETQSVASNTAATINVSATDDGLPLRRGRGGDEGPVGMTVEWAKYRGPGAVTLSPAKQNLNKGQAAVRASFSAPGEYILLAVVDDGSGESAGNFGYHCCWTNVQVKVTVK